MVKIILTKNNISIPAEVTVTLKSKVLTVQGPKGSIQKSFKNMSLQLLTEKDANGKISRILIRKWYSKKKQRSIVNSVTKHIQNMITGVTQGFKYTLIYGYKNKTIEPIAQEGGKLLVIKNFAGEKFTRKIRCPEGVKVETTSQKTKGKNRIFVMGIDVELVGLMASRIKQSCTIRKKDLRIFVDGIHFFKKEVGY